MAIPTDPTTLDSAFAKIRARALGAALASRAVGDEA